MSQQYPDRTNGSGGCRRAGRAGSAARGCGEQKRTRVSQRPTAWLVALKRRCPMRTAMAQTMPTATATPTVVVVTTETASADRFRAVGANRRSAPVGDYVSPLSTARLRSRARWRDRVMPDAQPVVTLAPVSRPNSGDQHAEGRPDCHAPSPADHDQYRAAVGGVSRPL